ncbi:hypothetical protein [Bacillus sp. FSL K6-3431]|uniref:hypothetical protein n=1 Tax=Bacillus sp. FSL K6-3431 TaxID=2921500 RepID=UPI0030F9AFFD
MRIDVAINPNRQLAIGEVIGVQLLIFLAKPKHIKAFFLCFQFHLDLDSSSLR